MLTLIAGESRVVVAPEAGGGIVGWVRGGVPILRPAQKAAEEGNFHAMACFPLLPYANRIGNGRFTWNGHAYQLPLNSAPHSIHGIGRERPWQIDQSSLAMLALSLHHAGDATWPFAFDATLGYRLDDDGLTVDLAITNKAAEPAPAGLGLHPYFPKANDAALMFSAAGAWQNDANFLPARHGPVPEDWQHETPRPVAGSDIDNCFTGWAGSAVIHAGPASLRIEASSVFGNLQVYTPPRNPFFAVEPVTHSPNAINHPDLPVGQGMAVLAPNERLAGRIHFILTGG
jgi:aldose 1-epimerase